jgi:hypothetical protein
VQDVEAIRAYVARDSPHYADLVVERIELGKWTLSGASE